MPYRVGDTVVLDGIESVIIYDNGSEADWGRYIVVDKNHDLSYYISGSDYVDSNDYTTSPGTFGYEWGFYNEQLPFASNSSNHTIGKGLETTNVIISNKDTTNTVTGGWYLLWDKVEEFRQSHTNKWFIPSINELSQVCSQKSFLKNISTSINYYYWTSSEASSSNAYSININNSNTAFSGKAGHSIRSRLCRYTTDSELDLLTKKSIQITSTTDQALIYYTIDNSTPTSNSTLYNNTFQVQTGTTIKAIGIKEGYIDSDIATLTV